jgi:hypothetical protein
MFAPGVSGSNTGLRGGPPVRYGLLALVVFLKKRRTICGNAVAGFVK